MLEQTSDVSRRPTAPGIMSLLSITPGEYTLEATSTGLQTTQIPNFSLAVNQTATLDVIMHVGTIQQTVSVVAAGELVQSSTAELGAVVATKQVVDLPLNGRNFTQLLSLSPGVVADQRLAERRRGFGNVAQRARSFHFPQSTVRPTAATSS